MLQKWVLFLLSFGFFISFSIFAKAEMTNSKGTENVTKNDSNEILDQNTDGIPPNDRLPSANEPDSATHKLSFQTNFGVTLFSAEDFSGTSTVTTKFFTGDLTLGLSWTRNWSERWSLVLGANYRQLSITQLASGSGKSIEKLSPSTLGAKIQIIRNFSKTTNLKFLFGQSQEVFFAGLNSSLIAIDTILLSYLGSDLSYLFYSTSHIDFALRGSYHYLFATSVSNYAIQSGNAYFGSFFFKSDSFFKNFETGVTYFYKSQSTDIIKKLETGVFLYFDYLFY